MDDREKVLLGGHGHYIAVKPWTPDFKPCEDTIRETMIWIRISDLSIWYYQDKVMMRIASAVGRPVKVDLATKLAEREKFARACMQINLGLPVVRSVIVDEFEYKVEYECLHLICDKCNCFGHPATDCRMTPIESERVDRKKTSVTETAARVVQPQEASKEKIFEFGCNPKESVIVAEIGEELDDMLHAKEVGSQHLENEAGWTKVSGKRREKLSQSNKVQQTSKDKVPVRSNQKLDQNRDFGLRMKGAESGVKTGSVSGSKARMASSKQQGVKGKAVSVAVPTFTAIIKKRTQEVAPFFFAEFVIDSGLPWRHQQAANQRIGRVVSGGTQTNWATTGQGQASYQGVGIVEANGHSGGIWVLCSNSNISVRVFDVVDQCISFKITMGNTSSYCSTGTFNDVLLQSEVRGGQFRLARAEQFAKILEDCGLFDMGAIGRKFTWYRKVNGGVQVAKKLDRAVIIQDWRLIFSEAYTEVLAHLHSDHCPLFTRWKMAERATKGHRPFRF
ncbi:uncharacterized protein [Arachis hypogaea]|uniref:uncharacterized protein n=1 Tax=Arachis hypogaea TaxID=3818 RepID=UPI000DEC94EE|nr:uncharacterized protein LOC112701022 [Arachis hypogaea]